MKESALRLHQKLSAVPSPGKFSFHSRVCTPVGFYRKIVSANLIKSGAG